MTPKFVNALETASVPQLVNVAAFQRLIALEGMGVRNPKIAALVTTYVSDTVLVRKLLGLYHLPYYVDADFDDEIKAAFARNPDLMAAYDVIAVEDTMGTPIDTIMRALFRHSNIPATIQDELTAWAVHMELSL